jgi:hypothetical protein
VQTDPDIHVNFKKKIKDTSSCIKFVFGINILKQFNIIKKIIKIHSNRKNKQMGYHLPRIFPLFLGGQISHVCCQSDWRKKKKSKLFRSSRLFFSTPMYCWNGFY